MKICPGLFCLCISEIILPRCNSSPYPRQQLTFKCFHSPKVCYLLELVTYMIVITVSGGKSRGRLRCVGRGYIIQFADCLTV